MASIDKKYFLFMDWNGKTSISSETKSATLFVESSFHKTDDQMNVDGDPTQYCEAIYVYPKETKHRLVVIAHGGPHGVSSVTHSPFSEFLLNAGFGLLMVNYRGSIGESATVAPRKMCFAFG